MIPIQVPMTVANDEVELSMSASVNNVQFTLDAGTGIVAIADYERLNHKPQINGVELVGNKTAEDLGLATPADIPTKTSELENDSGFITDAGVTSFNGQTGAVTYSAPVSSVNGQTGDVTISVPTKTSELQNDSGFITGGDVVTSFNGQTGDITYSAPVTSVNGQTGAVSLTIPTVPTDVSAFNNDVGYITTVSSSDVTNALGYTPYSDANPSGYVDSAGAASAAPVQSVNGQTGAVTISDSDSKVEQSSQTPSSYTYWRPLLVGASSNATEGFTPTTVTDKAYTFKTIEVQPSSGTIKANLKGDVTGTASGNYSASNPPPYPVTSVNSQTGAVSLSIPSTASDVGALPDDTTYAASPTVGGVASKAASIPFGKLDGTSTSTVMTATVSGITELKSGVCMWLMNGVVTGGSNFTLNINGLGAKPVYQSQAEAGRVSSVFNINYTALMIYNEDRVAGGCWDYVYGYDSNTNTIAYQVRTNNTILKTTDACRYYKVFFTSADGTHWVPASANTTNSATSAKVVNQRPIDPFGRIVYCSATTNYAAEGNIAAATIWDVYQFVLGYSFNRTGAALTLTTNAPVYIKAAPQSDGSAIIDADNPYVQALPNSEDGKIYIFLGVAYDATHIELFINHPVYHYKNGHVRMWTNADVGVTSVNGSTGAVTLSIPSTASDVGAVAVAQGAGHAGEFLVVGSNGNVTTMTLSTWQGGAY